MSKKSKKDKERASTPSDSNPKDTTNKPNQTPAKEAHNIPKATPQVPKGAMPSQLPRPVLPPSNQPAKSSTGQSGGGFAKPAAGQPGGSIAKPTSGQSGGSFHIPKGGDKRGRDPSQGSKSSIIPPPTKQPRTYANAAKGRELHRVQDHQWPDLQLRVYKNTAYHEPLSYDDFAVVREVMLQHSLAFLESNPDQGSLLNIASTYYNKLIHCGVYNFANENALNWFKQELPLACNHAFRGWTKDEQVTTFVKIFMPQGFESLSAQNYLKASRLMFRSALTQDIPWGLINESIHPTKHTRQIIASIPTATLQVIQAKGVETSEGSGVWKADGFLAPFKVTVASASDLRNANAANNSNPNPEQDQAELSAESEAAMVSPPASPARSTSSKSSSASSLPPPLGPELTPDKLPGLVNDQLLSAATNTEISGDNETHGEEVMDFGLLDDDAGGSWADEV